MSTPAEYYRSLPPVSKTYGAACLMTTAAYYLQLYDAENIALFYGLVFKTPSGLEAYHKFLLSWTVFTSIPSSSDNDSKNGVSLEKGPFDKRIANYVWMFIFGALSLLVMAVVPFLWSPFLGVSLVFMIVYIWSREFPNARINIYGVVSLKGFYLPWALLALDLIFGNPLKPDILGMLAGHLYYFLSVLHPLAGGKLKFKTPLWVHKIVAYWGEGFQINAPVQSNPSAGIVFRGRSHRLGSSQTTRRNTTEQVEGNASSSQQQNQGNGIAFRGRSYRLNG